MVDKETVNLLKDWGFEDNLIQHFKGKLLLSKYLIFNYY